MAQLDRLGKDVVHEICTNQVVVTLHACVKELVENALDAGAKRLELKLRESGSELLELVDDGHGISSENYERLAMRHATSKIREYEDLSRKLNTFGFRGEALSAICAMGDVTVCTRTAGDAAATLLTYDRFGKLASQVPAAREVGTTVSVRELFKRLPVRHREFLRNAKAQIGAALRLIQAYAIAQPEIRFHVLAEKSKGHGAGRATLMSSSGTAKGWRQSAAAMLGDAALVDVEAFELVGDTSGFTVSGLVSKPSGGRRTRDTQLFFCNRRPIDAPKRVVKLINDTFHQYSSRLWPVVILSFSASQNLVDVNVTPDKRTVFFHNEEALLKELQAKLAELYSSTTCEVASVNTLSSFGIRLTAPQSSAPDTSALMDYGAGAAVDVLVPASAGSASSSTAQELQGALADCKTPSNAATIDLDDENAVSNIQSQTPGTSRLLWQAKVAVDTPEKLVFGEAGGSSSGGWRALASNDESSSASAAPVTEFVPCAPAPETNMDASMDAMEGLSVVEIEQLPAEEHADSNATPSLDFQISELVPASRSPNSRVEDAVQDQLSELLVSEYSSMSQSAPVDPSGGDGAPDVHMVPLEPEMGLSELLVSEYSSMSPSAVVDPSGDAAAPNVDMTPREPEMDTEWDVLDGSGLPSLPEAPAAVSTIQADVSMVQLEAAIARRRQNHAAKLGKQCADVAQDVFGAKVTDMEFPSAFSLSSLRGGQGSASLDEVAKFASNEAGQGQVTDAGLKIDKSCFSEMRVIGQFNLGFIIAALPTKRRDDVGKDGQNPTQSDAIKPSGLQLFIIDQHASDEKFRFEALNRESKIDRQPLVSPHFLQLNPAQEQLAESHLEVFKLNGFEIKKDDSRPPGRRLQVASLPTCQGLMFGDKDIHELLYTLEQAESEQSEIRIEDSSQKSAGLFDIAGHRGLWSSTALPRPPKVWKMLANRACRYAIMIGKALRVGEMEKVLSNLGTLQQPWNCPHGRPTMRHLIDTAMAWRTPQRPAPLAAVLSET